MPNPLPDTAGSAPADDTPLPARGRILELDGLRALAIALVLLYHMAVYARSLPLAPSPWAAEFMARLGNTGVNLFFVISGYIITSILLREKASTGRVSLTGFYIRRFFRIVPPFAAYLAVLLVLQQARAIWVSGHDVLVAAFFLQDTSLADPNSGWFVAHTWSLSVEEQFYLTFPPFLCFVAALRKRIAVWGLSLFYLFALCSLKLSYELGQHVSPGFYTLAAAYRFRYIVAGVLAAMHSEIPRRFLAGKPRLLPAALAVLIILFQLRELRLDRIALLLAAVEPFLCVLFLLWFVQNPALCKPLRWPIVQWLGVTSYSIYLWHALFMTPARFYRGWGVVPQSPFLSLGAALLCAAFSYYCIELPSIRLGRTLSKRQSAAPATT